MSTKGINDINLPKDLFKDMSVEFLKTLDSQDEGTFYEFFQQLNLPDVKEARQRSEKVQEKNRELALENSEKEPEFVERKEELRRKVTEAQDLKDAYDRDFEELKKFQSRTELSTLRKQLQEATKTTEQVSEDFASDFVAGKSGLSVEEFIESLSAQRTEYWSRKVRLDKFDELSKNRQPRPSPRTRGPHPPEPVQPTKPTPYPPTSQPMPMQSLPVGGRNVPYPQSPRRTSESGVSPTSLPPYPTPRPPTQQPFPAAAYQYYNAGSRAPPLRPQQQQRAYPAPGYVRQPPPRPTPYSQYNQHRY